MRKTAPAAPVAAKPAVPRPAPARPPTPRKASIAVQAVPPAPPAPVCVVVAQTVGAGGHAWRMSGRHAVAYIKDAVLAGELLATEPRHLAKSAMAVYYDRKGKPFAWQVRFDSDRWDEVVGRLG